MCRALASRGLHEFEVSVLGNLALSSAEEAKALVPSLDPEHNPEVRVAQGGRARTLG